MGSDWIFGLTVAQATPTGKHKEPSKGAENRKSAVFAPNQVRLNDFVTSAEGRKKLSRLFNEQREQKGVPVQIVQVDKSSGEVVVRALAWNPEGFSILPKEQIKSGTALRDWCDWSEEQERKGRPVAPKRFMHQTDTAKPFTISKKGEQSAQSMLAPAPKEAVCIAVVTPPGFVYEQIAQVPVPQG